MWRSRLSARRVEVVNPRRVAGGVRRADRLWRRAVRVERGAEPSPELAPASVVEAARALAPSIRACADEAERRRRLPLELVREMAAMVPVLMPAVSVTLHDERGPLDVGTPFASVYPAVQNLNRQKA
jgi:hypothetical protein